MFVSQDIYLPTRFIPYQRSLRGEKYAKKQERNREGESILVCNDRTWGVFEHTYDLREPKRILSSKFATFYFENSVDIKVTPPLQFFKRSCH